MDTFMLSNDTLNILIVEKSHDEANRFISILRSADFNVDAKLATNEEELQKYISMRNWDLLLAALDYTTVPVQNIFQRIRRAERDVSVILISQQYSEKKPYRRSASRRCRCGYRRPRPTSHTGGSTHTGKRARPTSMSRVGA